jgi:hypothetical protein
MTLELSEYPSRIAMSCFHGKGREADRDVFSSFGFWSAVLHPFAWMRDYSLARMHIDDSITMRDSNGSFQDESELFERGRLAGLNPACRALQEGDAYVAVAGTEFPNVFVNQNGFIGGSFDSSRCRDQCGHLSVS